MLDASPSDLDSLRQFIEDFSLIIKTMYCFLKEK